MAHRTPSRKPTKSLVTTRPRSRVSASAAANSAGRWTTPLTLRLRKRTSATDYKLLKQSQTELANLWNLAVASQSVINGPRTRTHIYKTIFKGGTPHTSGGMRAHTADDVASAFKSFDAKLKRGDKASAPTNTRNWRRARWNAKHGRIVRIADTTLELCIHKGLWVTIDLSKDPHWQIVSKRCIQIAVDRDAADELILRVTCNETPETNLTSIQTRLRATTPSTAAIDPGVRNWTVVVHDDFGNTRAHVLNTDVLRQARSHLNSVKAKAQVAKAERVLADAERKFAHNLQQLLLDEAVTYCVIGTTPLQGWARASLLKRTYALLNAANISIVLADEAGTSRTCPRCNKVSTQTSYGAWVCVACGFARNNAAGRDVVAATHLLRTQITGASVPTTNKTFNHTSTQIQPVIPSARQQPRGSVPVLTNGTSKLGKDTHRHSSRHDKRARASAHEQWLHSKGDPGMSNAFGRRKIVSGAMVVATQTAKSKDIVGATPSPIGFTTLGAYRRCV